MCLVYIIYCELTQRLVRGFLSPKTLRLCINLNVRSGGTLGLLGRMGLKT